MKLQNGRNINDVLNMKEVNSEKDKLKSTINQIKEFAINIISSLEK
jgi:hypothetical protein